MAIHHKKLEKVIAEICENNQPLVIHNATERKQFIESLKEPLSKDKRVRTVYMGRAQSSKRPSWYDYIDPMIHSARRTTYCSPQISFNEQNELTIGSGTVKKQNYVGGLADIFAVIDALHKLFEQDDKEELKKEKINTLKATSMFGKLKEIAAEDGFEYAIEKKKLFATLMVKLNNRDALNIRVPYKNFQEVMQQVRPIIKSIRELTESGVNFQIKGFGYVSWNTAKTDDET